jgi:hypothetical protein
MECWSEESHETPVRTLTLQLLWASLIALTAALAIALSPQRASGNDCMYQAANDDESAFRGRFDLQAHSV